MAPSQHYKIETAPLTSAKFLDQSTLLVAGGPPNKITAYKINFSKKKKIRKYRELTLPEPFPPPASLDTNGEAIVVGFNEDVYNEDEYSNFPPFSNLRKYNWEDEHLVFQQPVDLVGPETTIGLSCVSDDGSVAVGVASNANSSSIIVYDPASLSVKATHKSAPVNDIHILPDGKVICWVTDTSVVGVSGVTGRTLISADDAAKKAGLRRINLVRFVSNDTVLLAGGAAKGLLLANFSFSKNNVTKSFKLSSKGRNVTSLDYCPPVEPRPSMVVLADDVGSVLVLRYPDFRPICVFDKKTAAKGGVAKVTFLPSGEYVAAVSEAIFVAHVPLNVKLGGLLVLVLYSGLSLVFIAVVGLVIQYVINKRVFGHLVEQIRRNKADSSLYFTLNEVHDTLLKETSSVGRSGAPKLIIQEIVYDDIMSSLIVVLNSEAATVGPGIIDSASGSSGTSTRSSIGPASTPAISSSSISSASSSPSSSSSSSSSSTTTSVRYEPEKDTISLVKPLIESLAKPLTESLVKPPPESSVESSVRPLDNHIETVEEAATKTATETTSVIPQPTEQPPTHLDAVLAAEKAAKEAAEKAALAIERLALERRLAQEAEKAAAEAAQLASEAARIASEASAASEAAKSASAASLSSRLAYESSVSASSAAESLRSASLASEASVSASLASEASVSASLASLASESSRSASLASVSASLASESSVSASLASVASESSRLASLASESSVSASLASESSVSASLASVSASLASVSASLASESSVSASLASVASESSRIASLASESSRIASLASESSRIASLASESSRYASLASESSRSASLASESSIIASLASVASESSKLASLASESSRLASASETAPASGSETTPEHSDIESPVANDGLILDGIEYGAIKGEGPISPDSIDSISSETVLGFKSSDLPEANLDGTTGSTAVAEPLADLSEENNERIPEPESLAPETKSGLDPLETSVESESQGGLSETVSKEDIQAIRSTVTEKIYTIQTSPPEPVSESGSESDSEQIFTIQTSPPVPSPGPVSEPTAESSEEIYTIQTSPPVPVSESSELELTPSVLESLSVTGSIEATSIEKNNLELSSELSEASVSSKLSETSVSSELMYSSSSEATQIIEEVSSMASTASGTSESISHGTSVETTSSEPEFGTTEEEPTTSEERIELEPSSDVVHDEL